LKAVQSAVIPTAIQVRARVIVLKIAVYLLRKRLTALTVLTKIVTITQTAMTANASAILHATAKIKALYVIPTASVVVISAAAVNAGSS
jgi:hypothetical protein